MRPEVLLVFAFGLYFTTRRSGAVKASNRGPQRMRSCALRQLDCFAEKNLFRVSRAAQDEVLVFINHQPSPSNAHRCFKCFKHFKPQTHLLLQCLKPKWTKLRACFSESRVPWLDEVRWAFFSVSSPWLRVSSLIFLAMKELNKRYQPAKENNDTTKKMPTQQPKAAKATTTTTTTTTTTKPAAAAAATKTYAFAGHLRLTQ